MGITHLSSWLRSSLAPSKTRRDDRARLRAELLEDRTTPSTFTVTWDGSPARPAGTVTLQDAINLANANPGADNIIYGNSPITGLPVVQSIVLSTASGVGGSDDNGPLPAITGTLTIDGVTTNGPGTAAKVLLTSKTLADAVQGFYITGGAANSVIKNIVITDPSGTLNFNAIPTEIGVKVDATAGGFNLQNATISNIDGDAVRIINSPNNIVGGTGNLEAVAITSNNGNGVRITGAASLGNHVEQATITKNAGDGVRIDTLAGTSQIGSGSAALGTNVINQNNGNGVHLNASSNNFVQRNIIGTDASGAANFANTGQGVFIENSSNNNLVGGNDTTLNAGNKIAGNTENGIYILNSSGTQVQCNIIGINPASTAVALSNNGNGILVENSPNSRIGNTTTAANFIAGNNLAGVSIIGAASTGSVVVNNRIGIAGTSLTTQLDTKLGNVLDGVFVGGGATNVTVGGGGTNAQNIIGANRNGIAVDTATNISILGNQLGINKLANGTYPSLGNLGDGINVNNSTNVTIGGTQSLQGNKAAGNRNGIHVIGSSGIVMQGNSIGPNLTGTIIPITVGLVENFEPAFQSEDGILVESSTNVKVGTSAQGGGNLMSHNRHGVSITKGSSNVTIQNNNIGTQNPTNARTKHDLGNQDDGVFIDASTNVLIGGTGAAEGNTIAKNLDGIQISGGSSFVTVQGNLIRNNSQSGVRIEGSNNNLIGGNVPAAKNTIENRRLPLIDSTFTIDGVFIVAGPVNGATTSSFANVVQGNYIGTDSTAATNTGLTGNGVLIDGSHDNKIGITTALTTANATALGKSEGNIITNNAFNGIAVVESSAGPGTANGNQLSGNSIFLNGRLGIDLGNTAGIVNPNDFKDPDLGANNSQNYPVLVLAQSAQGTGTRIQGILNSTPNRNFRVELFFVDVTNPNGNPPNFGQGRQFIGFVNVTTDANGDANFTFVDPTLVLPASQFISATATDLVTFDTSEFSLTQVIEGAPGPTTYVVNNDGNIFPTEGADLLIPPNGNMTLSLAIRLANEHPGADRIVFSENPQYTINGTTITYYEESRNLFTNGNLPDITDTLIIDGSHLAWPQTKGGDKRFTQDYGIVLNNASHGLVISDNPTAQAQFANPTAQAGLVVLRHISISGAAGVGVEIDTKFGGANLQDVRIQGFSSDGVRIVNSPNNIIGGSGTAQSVTITSVSGSGVNILGAGATNNLIQQTNIGFPVSATGSGGAGGNGIWIQGANNNTIGGFQAGSGVIIQGSGANGIYLVNSSGTRIQRSTIGDPTDQFPNHFDGIRVEDSASTLIGGVTQAAGNTIAGNTEQGIDIVGSLSAGAQIQSNQIGTSAAPNSGNGIFVNNVAGVLIGSTVTAANRIDGNNLNGILISGSNASGARIINTSVGSGGGNLLDGIVIDSTSDVVIGGATSNAGGTVAGNRRGISILNSSKLTIQQMTVSANSEDGVRIDGSSSLLIGGTASSIAGNTITGNRDGVSTMNGSSGVTLQGNTISNQSEDGVIIDNTGTVVVGTASQFGDNKINGNRNGVRVINGSTNFSIQHNTINNNRDDGVRLDGIANATIGGTASLSPNIVSGNRNGLHLSLGSNGATILQNQFSNSIESGILLEGSSNDTIGGQVAWGLSGAQGNVIFSNGLNGIYFKPDFTDPSTPIFSNNNTVKGNWIGVNATGVTAAGNANSGIYIDGGNNNKIGGTVHDSTKKLEEGNIIANSGASGMVVVTDNGPAAGNTIEGNRIFNSGQLGIELGSNLGLVHFNDLMDPDTGANNVQNFPVVSTAESGSIATIVNGTFNSTPSRTFRLEFFGVPNPNPTGNPVGYGQGQTFLGFQNVTTDASGNATYNFQSLIPFATGSWVSATATDLTTGDTSEFGLAVQATTAQGVISGQKFNDLNGNGIKDAGEPGLQGWEIDLDYQNDGTIDAKAFTDAAGNYSFVNLTNGNYKVSEVQKAGWVQTAQPNPNPFQITGELTIANQNFGNFKLDQISGHKFNDVNGNGVQDPNDGPVANIVIDLYQISKAGTVTRIAQTKTDTSGNYAFANLGPLTAPVTGLGPITLRVREELPLNTTQTTVDPPDFVLVSGTNVTGLDFGNHGTGGGGGPPTDHLPGDNMIVVGTDAGTVATVRVLDATTQKQLFSFVPFGGFTGGVRVAKGDVNGDGFADIIVAAGPGGGPHVIVYDGVTGAMIRSFMAYNPGFTGGVFVGATDVNGDHADDIITGAGTGGGPHVRVFDGQSGIELMSFFAYGSTFGGGVRVAGGDVNGDGFGDVITGAGPGGGPHVRIWSGATAGQPVLPTEIRGFYAYSATFTGGVFVAPAHIDNDQHTDIVVGPGSGGGPEVKVFDGDTGGVLRDFLAFGSSAGTTPSSLFTGDSQFFTGVHVGSSNSNADGISDISVGPGAVQSSHLIVWSGKDLTKIADVNPVFDPGFLGGIWVA